MNKDIIATESFTHYGKTYFFDYLRAVNGSDYIRITRSDRQLNDTFERHCITVFEENFQFLLEAMSSLFRTAGYLKATGTGSETRITGIKSWDPVCRPREKMMEKGTDAMTDTELLAMLIGSGSPRETAIGLARRILSGVDFNLIRLAKSSVEELCTYHGMGYAKSLTILAALELANRMAEQQLFFPITR